MSGKTKKPYCRAKACGSPLVDGQSYCEFHLARAQLVAAKARATVRRKWLEGPGQKEVPLTILGGR